MRVVPYQPGFYKVNQLYYKMLNMEVPEEFMVQVSVAQQSDEDEINDENFSDDDVTTYFS